MAKHKIKSKSLDLFIAYVESRLTAGPEKIGEFCKNAGVSRSTLDNWRRFESSPGLDDLDRLAPFLGKEQPWELIKPESTQSTKTLTEDELWKMVRDRDVRIRILETKLKAIPPPARELKSPAAPKTEGEMKIEHLRMDIIRRLPSTPEDDLRIIFSAIKNGERIVLPGEDSQAILNRLHTELNYDELLVDVLKRMPYVSTTGIGLIMTIYSKADAAEKAKPRQGQEA